MPKAALKRTTLVSFETLVRKVKEAFLLGRKRIKQEMVRTYWQTGKYIHEHILLHRDHADYGEKVISRLSERVGMSERSLREILQVYRQFPEIRRSGAELRWSHFRSLASIPDARIRKEFAKRAVRGNWTAEKLKSKIKAEFSPGSEEGGATSDGRPPDYSEITRPKLGTLYTYRLISTVAGEGALKIDQGFRVYRTEFDLRSKFKAGDIAESLKDKDGTYSAVKSNRGAEDLFTYKAFVERVVDGDTLLVEIDLGFTNTTRQYLRLRALDAPEIKTVEGRRAKEFVASLLKPAPFIFLTTTRSDKFDRYLADVFIPGKDFLKRWFRASAVLNPSQDLLYLNNELLKNSLAVRMRY